MINNVFLRECFEGVICKRLWFELTLNYQMIVERYLNKWSGWRFDFQPWNRLSTWQKKTNQVVKHLMSSKFKRRRRRRRRKLTIYAEDHEDVEMFFIFFKSVEHSVFFFFFFKVRLSTDRTSNSSAAFEFTWNYLHDSIETWDSSGAAG